MLAKLGSLESGKGAYRSGRPPLKVHSKSTVLAGIEFARSTGIGFNLAYIGKDFHTNAPAGLNAEYMRAMYAYGHMRVTAVVQVMR